MAVLPVTPDQVATVWEQVLLKVRDRLTSSQAFDTWFRPIVAREFGPQSVDLEVPNAFFVDWIHEHHLHLLRQAFTDVGYAGSVIAELDGGDAAYLSDVSRRIDRLLSS